MANFLDELDKDSLFYVGNFRDSVYIIYERKI